MLQLLLLVLVTLGAGPVVEVHAANIAPIEHIVVLMLENRAFDHMCGYLKSLNREIDGLNGNESNPYNPYDSKSELAYVDDKAPYVEADPGHSIPDTTMQVFGGSNRTWMDPAPMNGFVRNAEETNGGWGPKIMQCFNPTTVPAISTLAQEFALFDRWYSSVPGPTQVNRAYVHSGTSHGLGTNDVEKLLLGLPQKTIYESLEEVNKTWTVYFEQATGVLFFTQMRAEKYWGNYKDFLAFADDVNSGDLAYYTFIEPRYFGVTDLFPANDQHPSHNVDDGEALINYVYTTLRNSPLWEKSLLILTYDEHGGFFDHVPPPQKGVPSPDGIPSTDPPFDFTRLGVRIPTIMASPWINKGVVVHEANGPYVTSHYEHSSIPATLKKINNIPDFLTKRDAWAGTFEWLLTERTTPRTDCPKTLPTAPLPVRKKGTHLQGLNDLQKEWIADVAAINGNIHDIPDFKTEAEAGLWIVEQMEKFFRGHW